MKICRGGYDGPSIHKGQTLGNVHACRTYQEAGARAREERAAQVAGEGKGWAETGWEAGEEKEPVQG